PRPLARLRVEPLEERSVPAITTTPASLSFTEGISNTVAVGTFSDTDPSADSDYTAAIAWGDGGTTAGTVTGDGAGNFTVTGTHTYPDELAVPLPVTVTVQEANGSDTDTGTISSTAQIADALLHSSSTTFGVTEGNLFTGTVASFTDDNP